jgi:hypothetical protein
MINPATLIETKSENSQTRVIGMASIWAGSIFLSRACDKREAFAQG